MTKLDSPAAAQTVAQTDPRLPVEGYADLEMGVDEMWRIFSDVRGWPRWNPGFAAARVLGGELGLGARLAFLMNPPGRAPYKLPVTAPVVEYQPRRRLTWRNSFPGCTAWHSWVFEDLGPDRCRFGSWEVLAGPVFDRFPNLWLPMVRHTCETAVAGARTLPGSIR